MKKTRIVLAVLLLLLSLQVQGQKSRTRPVNIDSVSCVNSPLLAELVKPPAAAILSSYGYNLHEPWACTKINSSWTAGSIMLHFQRVTAQSDDTTAFSVMKVAGIAHIWVIPTGAGMLEAPHAESDPHNLAAFNAFLSTLSRAPSSAADWTGIGKLYMALLGHKEAIPVESETSTGSPCNSDGDCSVAFADRPPRSNEAYTKWTLTFSAPSSTTRLKLADASREVVQPSGS